MSRLPTVTHLMRKVFSILNRAEKLEKVHDMSPLLHQQDGAHQQISRSTISLDTDLQYKE